MQPISFVRHAKGATAIIFAIALLPLAGLVMGGIEYSYLADKKSAMNALADAATTDSVSHALLKDVTFAQRPAKAKKMAEDNFRSQFSAHWSKMPSDAKIESLNVVSTQDKGRTTTTLSYVVKINAQTRLFGSGFEIKGTSTATQGSPTFVDIHIMVDASGSMGIGADQNDITKMMGSIGCSLACHDSGTDTQAHNAGATLRFDVAKRGIKMMIDKAKTVPDQQIRFIVRQFGNTVTRITKSSDTLDEARSKVSNMQLNGGDNQSTHFNVALEALNKAISSSGDGSEQSPMAFVVLITDGVENEWKRSPAILDYSPMNVWNGEQNQGFNPALCSTLKGRKVPLMTLYTEYVIPTGSESLGEERYPFIRDQLKPLMKGRFESCATKPSYAYSANSSTEIEGAMKSIMEKILEASVVQITQ